MFGKNSQLYRYNQTFRNRLKKIPRGLDVLCLGSSIAENDIDFEMWDVCGYNLASSPQPLCKDFLLLKKYYKKVKSGGTVLITLAEFALLVDDYFDDMHQYKYYAILEKSDIANYTHRKAFLYHHAPFLLDKYFFTDEIKQFIKKIIHWQRGKHDSRNTVLLSAQNYWDAWNQEFDLEHWNEKEAEKILKKTCAVLNEMIDFCRQRGLRPVVAVLPMCRKMKHFIPEEILEKCLWEPLRKIDKTVLILDFYRMPGFDKNYYYKDAIRLNAKGKVMLNRMLRKKIDNGNKEKKAYKLYHITGTLDLPWIAFGTGVIWKYTRNPKLFFKINGYEVLLSIRHLCLHRELYGNIYIRRIIREAYDAGFRLFDTGRIYAFSEKYLGEISSYENVFFSTKCSAMDITRECSPSTVRGNLKVSLKYLKREQADILMLHWPEGDNWISIYAQIVEEYKRNRTRAFGACNMGLEQLKVLQENHLPYPQILQTELHPLNSKKELRQFCAQNGIQMMAHTPTARACDEVCRSKAIKDLSDKYGKSPVQIILRWHFQNHVIPVVSCFKQEHMRENMDIFDFELTSLEMESIELLDSGRVFLQSDGIDDPGYIYNL